ncbi:MAG: hypothetical protein DI617_06865 [Streptococcus pyogenes]|nr:MAG: hypothetical protein DI617_06865 [Streptococcus pyogenes]
MELDKKEAEVKIPEHTFEKSFFDLVTEGYKNMNYYQLSNGSEELAKIPDNVKNILADMKTDDLVNLFIGMFARWGAGGSYASNQEAINMFDTVNRSGLHALFVPNGGANPWDTGLFKKLLLEEVLRRGESYQELVEGLKKMKNSADRNQSKLEHELEKKENSISTLTEGWHKQNDKIIKLKAELKDSVAKQTNLQDEITQAKKENHDLKAKSDKLTSQLSDSEQSNKELQAKTKDLEAKVQEAADEAKVLHEQVIKATNQNQNLQSQLESKQKDLTDLQQQLTSDRKLSEEDKAKLQSDLDAKQDEVNQLQAKVDESKVTLDKLTAEKAAADAKVAELTAQKAEIEAKLNSQTELSAEEKAKLEKQLADIQSKIAEKDASIKSLEGQLDTLKQQEQEKTPETPQVPEVKPEDKPAEPQQPETKPQAPHAPETGKPSTPKKPEIKPAPTPAIPEVKPSTPHTPEKPGKGKPAAPKANHDKAHHAATPASPHMAASSTPNTAAQLPQTGETTANPFFTVAALSVIASAGVLATKRKED